MKQPRLHIALCEPEIPGNTGNIGRLVLGLEARLHLIHPLGFSVEEKAVRRAGLDHWSQVDLQQHEDHEAFWHWAEGRRVHLFSTRGRESYAAIPWQPGDVLLFGCETRGLPAAWLQERPSYRIPIPGAARSLNLSNAVAVVSYAAYASLCPADFGVA